MVKDRDATLSPGTVIFLFTDIEGNTALCAGPGSNGGGRRTPLLPFA
jgi:hypothetical protein